jgi:hypothetical protein
MNANEMTRWQLRKWAVRELGKAWEDTDDYTTEQLREMYLAVE